MTTNPKAIEALNIGLGFFNQKQFEMAFTQFSRAKKLAPKNFDATYLTGVSLYRLDRLGEAQKFLAQASSMNPQHAEVLNTLGNVFGRLGKPFSAIKAYKKAINVQPDYISAYVNLGIKLKDSGSHEEALAVLKEALQRDESSNQIALAIAETYIEWKQFNIAENFLDRVESLSGKNKLVDFRRMSIQVASCDFVGIEAGFVDFEKNYGSTAELIQLTAKFLFEAGRMDEAISFIEASLRLRQDNYLMSLYLKLKGLMEPRDQFLKLVKDVVSMSLQQSDYALIAIEHLMLADEVDSAQNLFEQLSEARSQSIRGLILGANIYECVPAEMSRALKLAQKANAKNPEHEGAAICLARILLRSGDFKMARNLISHWRVNCPSSQFWIAYEAIVARKLNPEHYSELCDYENMIQVYELEIPQGYKNIEEFNADLAVALTKLHCFAEAPLDQSLRAGTQSIRSLEFEKNPVIQQYIRALDKPIRAYIRHLRQFENIALGGRISLDYVIQGCWSVRLKKGGRHVNHVHPEGWISSAYYVQTPTEGTDGKDGWIKFGEPPFPIEGIDKVERWIKPEAGKLVLFPSYFWHGVSPVKSDGIRITAPFDVVPSLPA